MKIRVKAMEKCLQDRLEQIKQIAVSEIKKMPSCWSEKVKINDKVCTLATWRNQRADGMIEVVFQVYYTG